MELIEFLEDQVVDQLRLLLLDSYQLHLELILGEVSGNQQVCVELWGFVQATEEIVVLELCQWPQVLIAREQLPKPFKMQPCCMKS